MSEKLRLKNEDEYATYEEYNDIMDISMSLSNENQSLQSQLDIANKKLDKIRKYVTEKLIYIDNCDDQETILSIIGGE